MIGREAELSLLNERYNSDRYEMMPIYGRKLVGKTTLLKEFVRDKNGVYFSATRVNIHDNINRLGSRILGIDSKVEMSLDEVLAEVRKRSMNERYLLIIDEYPNLIRKSPEINDILQEFLDEMGESKLFLILCGSSVSIMHHEVLGYKSPIYGRRTGSLEIHPMNIWESMKILNRFDRDDALKIYGMVGGLPVTKDFTDFIEQHTGYEDAGIFSRTDIVVLCRDICGVNLSVGYYHEHTPSETLIFDEWFHTLTLAQQLLLPEQKRYLLDHIR